MAEKEALKTYRGNCHCGAFIYEITRPELKQFSECNCGICRKKGYAWFVAGADDVKVVKGDIDALKAYTFNEGHLIHKFCGTCATPLLAFRPAAPPERNMFLNARALQDVDIWKLEKTTFDGKKYGPPYQPPEYTGPAPGGDFEGGGKVYTGSCHCGAVKVAVRTPKPLEDYNPHAKGERVLECNCSICVRLADIWIYPNKENIRVEGAENQAYYSLWPRVWRKTFCRKCGVHVMSEFNQMQEEEAKALPEHVQRWRTEYKDCRPLNIRVLNDFDFTTLDTVKSDGWNTVKPMYVNP